MSYEEVNGGGLVLKGTQVNFNNRKFLKDRTNSRNSIMSLRPFSASTASLNYKKEKNVNFKLKRPLSADTIYKKTDFENMNEENFCDDLQIEENNLPSSQILQSLLNEPITRWQNENFKCYDSNSDTSSEKSLGTQIKELSQKVSEPGILLPGVKTKPPLPQKKKFESLHLNIYPHNDVFDFKNEENDSCFIEDLEDEKHELLNTTDEIISKETTFNNWLQENNNLILQTKLHETQTDLELQNVHQTQIEVNENILNLELYTDTEDDDSSRKKTKSTEGLNNKKPKINRATLYRTEFQKNKKNPKETVKKNPKSILKTQNPKKIQSIIKQHPKTTQKQENTSLDNVKTWMSSNAKHGESFLEFLNKLDDLETGNDTGSSRPNSQRSYMQDSPVHDEEKKVNTTCDEIVEILEVLEKEDLKSQKSIESYKEILNTELSDSQNFKHSIDTSSSTSSLASSTNYNEFLTYLDEVDKSSMKTLQTAKDRVKSVAKVTNALTTLDSVPKLEDLLNYSQVDLAHYIVDLSIRLKEKSSGIQTLQTEISKLHKLIKTKSDDHEKHLKQTLKNLKEEYEPVIKRHQKFIDQLISDKKSLNQQCEGLINEMKVLEDGYNTNMKAVDQRHKIELQKAKEMHMAAEKLRRDKWIEGKTAKIKEMTVKGLEPELQNMAARQQQELSDLRSLHKKEIEELELRAARKTQQQCEALRQQLTLEREQGIAHEREILRQRLEKLVEAEEKSYQELRRRLNSEHASRLSELDERISLITSEKERGIEAARAEFEDKYQTALRRHKTEMKNLRESMDLEMDVWKNNFKKQQNIKMAEVEGKLREVCKKERDKEIEVVIERLEKEADEMKNQMEQAADNRLRRIKEKYDEEIKDLEAILNDYKSKYSETKEKLLASEDNLLNLKTSMKQVQSQLQQAKQISEELSMDKNKVREQIKEEFVKEIKNLEEEIRSLKNGKEEEMQRIFSKVRLTVNHKDELLSELSQNNSNLQEKCTLLENLLEQQRKEFLIK